MRRRIGLVAGREVMAAVTSRGFVLGLLLMPTLVALMAVFMPRLMNATGPVVVGQVGVVDATGHVSGALGASLTPAAIVERRNRTNAEALAALAAAAGVQGPAPTRASGEPPRLTLVNLPPGDVPVGRQWLTAAPTPERRLALVVVHPTAVSAGASATLGTYDLYVPPNADERIEGEVRGAMREALVTARALAHSVDRAELDALTRVVPPPAVTVLASGQQATAGGFNRLMPFVMAGLLVFGVMIGAQTLLTATIEEKSSRVIEVLLSAVSPFELMAGKILGQMAVSLFVLALYIGLGVAMLTSFAMVGLLDPWLIVYLVCFFLIAFFMFAAVFCAIGGAVSEMRDAQALVTPVMLALMAPWMMAPAIARRPDAPFAVAMSLVPPMNSFAMMVRLASSTPPPAWQVWLSMGLGVAGAVAATWVAAKIFRVGLLMHGKPPNFATLARWVRQG